MPVILHSRFHKYHHEMNAHADSSQRFLFDGADVRGESVRIDGALADMLANQAYSPTLKCLLGEFAAAAVMIA